MLGDVVYYEPSWGVSELELIRWRCGCAAELLRHKGLSAVLHVCWYHRGGDSEVRSLLNQLPHDEAQCLREDGGSCTCGRDEKLDRVVSLIS